MGPARPRDQSRQPRGRGRPTACGLGGTGALGERRVRVRRHEGVDCREDRRDRRAHPRCRGAPGAVGGSLLAARKGNQLERGEPVAGLGSPAAHRRGGAWAGNRALCVPWIVEYGACRPGSRRRARSRPGRCRLLVLRPAIPSTHQLAVCASSCHEAWGHDLKVGAERSPGVVATGHRGRSDGRMDHTGRRAHRVGRDGRWRRRRGGVRRRLRRHGRGRVAGLAPLPTDGRRDRRGPGVDRQQHGRGRARLDRRGEAPFVPITARGAPVSGLALPRRPAAVRSPPGSPRSGRRRIRSV